MLSGACATPEFLMYMNYFVGKEYGEDYYLHPEKVVDLSSRQRTIDKVITDCFEQEMCIRDSSEREAEANVFRTFPSRQYVTRRGLCTGLPDCAVHL